MCITPCTVYVPSSDACNVLDFAIGTDGGTLTRQWSIKVVTNCTMETSLLTRETHNR